MNNDELARKVAERIEAMEPGASETLARVACEVSGADFREIEEILFNLENEVVSLLDERGIVLDRSAYWNMVVGLPYNIPFEVRPIVNGRRGPIKADEVERLLFSADSFSASRADMLIARDESGMLSKTVQGFFTSEFAQVIDAPLSEGEMRALHEALGSCGAESWYREYPHGLPEVAVLDGDSWEMRICLSDGTCISCSGINDYPESFDVLTSALISLGFPNFWA